MWLRVILTIACLFLSSVSAAPSSYRRTPTVTLPAGLYSFDELARALSADDRIVTCSPDISHRAAFVSLRPRPWPEAAEILSEALSVRFKPDEKSPDRRWLMEPDPKVVERDRQWVGRFVDNAHQEILRDLHRDRDLLARSPAELWVMLAEATARFEAYRRGREEDSFEADSPEEREYRRLSFEQRRIRSIAEPLGWLVRREVRSVSLDKIREAVTNNGSVAPAQSLGALSLFPEETLTEDLTPDLAAALQEPGSSAMAVWELDPTRLNVRLTLHCLARNGAAATSGWTTLAYGSARELFEGRSVGQGAGTGGLGKGAVDWLSNERRSTREFLETDDAKRLFEITSPRRATHLSQLIESWCSDAEAPREAVMELVPQRESVQRLPGTQRLPDLRAGVQTSLRIMLREDDESEASDWSLRMRRGVLIVKDQLGFLDRLCSPPMRYYLDAAREIQKARAETPKRSATETSGAPSTVPYSIQVRHAEEELHPQIGRWLDPAGEVYCGVDMGYVAALPYVGLWKVVRGRLTSAEKADILDGSIVHVEMARVGLSDRNDFVRRLQALKCVSPLATRPGLARELAGCSVLILLPDRSAFPDMPRSLIFYVVRGQDVRKLPGLRPSHMPVGALD